MVKHGRHWFLISCILMFCSSCVKARNNMAENDDVLLTKFTKAQDSEIFHRIAYITSYNSNTRNPN